MTAEVSISGAEEPRTKTERVRARLPTWFVAGMVIFLIAVKLVFALVVLPNEDEAYYFQWGQHLALSYFDHAPLHGWMQGLSAALFGFTTLGLRAMNQLTLLGTALVFWACAGRLEPDDRVNTFWTILAVYLASPLIFGITTLSYPDHWLMFLCIASAYFLALFLGERLEGRAGRYRDLYAGAALLGLAALAKYNAVTMGVALAAFIVFHPKLRPLLRDVHLYLAALVSVTMLSPILIWNVLNGFVSIRFQLYERYGPGGPGGWGEFSVDRFLPFAVLSVTYISVALMPALVAFYLRPGEGGFRGALVGLAKWTFAVSTLVICAISFFAKGAPHWNIVGIIAFLSVAYLFVRWRWLLAMHLLLGAGMMTAATAYFAGFPLVNASFLGDREASSYYGYDQVAARMESLRAEHGAAGIAAISYGAAAKLAFGAGPGNAVTALTPVFDSFDLWRDEEALIGRDIIIHDEFQAIGLVAPQFEEMVKLEDITVTRFDRPIITYELYLGRSYRGLTSAR